MLGCRRGERPGHEHAHPDLPDARMPGRPNPPDAPDGGMSQTPQTPQTPKPPNPPNPQNPQTPTPQTPQPPQTPNPPNPQTPKPQPPKPQPPKPPNPQTPTPQTPTPQTPTPQTPKPPNPSDVPGCPGYRDGGTARCQDGRTAGCPDALDFRIRWLLVLGDCYAGVHSPVPVRAGFLRAPRMLVCSEIVCSGGRRTFSDARGRVICGRPISRGMPMAIRRGASACGMPMAIWHGASAAPCGQKRPHSVTFAAFVFLRLGVCRENTCSRACAFDYLSKRIMNRGDFVQFASRSPLLPRSSKRPLRLACVALSCERLFRLVHVVLISRVPLCSRAPSPCPYRERPRVPQSGKCLPAPRFASPSRLPHPLRPAGSPRERPSGLACTRARLLVKKSSLVFCRSSAMSGAGFPPPPIRAFRVRKMTGGIRVFSSPRTESTLH